MKKEQLIAVYNNHEDAAEAIHTLLKAGVIAGYFTFISNPKDWWGWLKAVVLIGVGLLILFYPISRVQAIGLLLIFLCAGATKVTYDNKKE